MLVRVRYMFGIMDGIACHHSLRVLLVAVILPADLCAVGQ